MEIINDVNGLFEFQDLGARTELKNKANIIISNTKDKTTSNVLTDSFSHNIKSLFLYGSSTQSTVPTPTAPVTIENVNNPAITLYKKNLFDMSKCIKR